MTRKTLYRDGVSTSQCPNCNELFNPASNGRQWIGGVSPIDQHDSLEMKYLPYVSYSPALTCTTLWHSPLWYFMPISPGHSSICWIMSFAPKKPQKYYLQRTQPIIVS